VCGLEPLRILVCYKKTGNRIRYLKVDAETGNEVDSADIIKGYEVGKGQYIEIQPEELEAIAIESKRTIEIDCYETSPPLQNSCARGHASGFAPKDGKSRIV
jgi:non-homologous end joining protein Ku